MKISVKNFKSIVKLDEFEIKPLTILSGINSSGKSSFLQLLLLLKQTTEAKSEVNPLSLKGDFYSVNSFLDLLTGKNSSSNLEVKFEMDKKEFSSITGYKKSLFDSFENYKCNLSIVYNCINNKPQIKHFELSYDTEVKKESFTITHITETEIEINTSSDYLLKLDYSNDGNVDVTTKVSSVNFVAFFPSSIEVSIQAVNKDILDKRGNPTISVSRSTSNPNIESIKSFIDGYFKSVYYIGPLRISPKDIFQSKLGVNWVGIEGEYAAQLLENFKDKIIECNVPVLDGDLIRFQNESITLLEATNIWMCKIFKIGKRIYSKDNGENYTVFIENDNGLETTIKHVGFGISQVLPVVVQGLLAEKGDTLILEQPEIHLHPKMQSSLFDFIYSLILQHKKIILETHSDHFITRLRRRVAEDESSSLQELVNLTFIESSTDRLTFTKIMIDELGLYQLFPENFIDSPEKELQALLNAQMKKRKSKRNQ